MHVNITGENLINIRGIIISYLIEDEVKERQKLCLLHHAVAWDSSYTFQC